MSLLNVGARALLANQVALQTAGHNIANVNTPGYSRQTVVLQTVQGQFTGGGYIGQGVDVQTILRNQSELLTRQSAAAGSTQAADIVRSERLRQLQEVFSGGTAGLGAAINDMMNAFSDVVSSPTDITARTVVLTRLDETAARMRTAGERLNELQYTVTEQLQSSVTTINSLAKQMANINEQIARANGNGQSPNDLLDQRDQIIRDINQYVQTTQIPADDGTVGLFVAGSQPLVLGTTASSLSIDDATQFPASGQIKLFFNRPGAPPVEMDENVLGGGSVSGLLRFNNNDLTEGRNLLGRMAMAIGMTMNDQQNLGLTLDGLPGKDLFALPASMPGYTNGAGVGTVSFTGPTQFAASDYEIRFTTGTAGQVVRLSDGKSTPFTSAANLATLQIDGLNFNLTTPGNPGERMLFKPFSTAANNIQALVYSPRDLAVANPINAAMGTANGGTMQLGGLKATGLPNPPGLVLPANANPAALPPILGGGAAAVHRRPAHHLRRARPGHGAAHRAGRRAALHLGCADFHQRVGDQAAGQPEDGRHGRDRQCAGPPVRRLLHPQRRQRQCADEPARREDVRRVHALRRLCQRDCTGGHTHAECAVCGRNVHHHRRQSGARPHSRVGREPGRRGRPADPVPAGLPGIVQNDPDCAEYL